MLCLDLPLYKFRAMWIISYCKKKKVLQLPFATAADIHLLNLCGPCNQKLEFKEKQGNGRTVHQEMLFSSAKIYCIHAMGEKGFDKLINLPQVFLPLKSCPYSQTASLLEVGRDSAQRPSRHSDTVALYFKDKGREIERCVLLGQSGIIAERGHL